MSVNIIEWFTQIKVGVFTIAHLTIREAIRRKIALASILLGIAVVVVYSVGVHFSLQDMRKYVDEALVINSLSNMLLIMGMYAVNFLVVVMAALLSANSLAGEISSGTILTLASKPIRRSQVVVGKWAGLAFLLLAYELILFGGVVLGSYLQSQYVIYQPLKGFLLIYLEGLLVMTVTLALSSTLSTLATGGTVFGLYGVAFIGNWIEQIGGGVMGSQAAIDIGIVASLIMPSEVLWRRASFEMTSPFVETLGGFPPPLSSSIIPSRIMMVYTAAYMIFALIMAVRKFSTRDL